MDDSVNELIGFSRGWSHLLEARMRVTAAKYVNGARSRDIGRDNLERRSYRVVERCHPRAGKNSGFSVN